MRRLALIGAMGAAAAAFLVAVVSAAGPATGLDVQAFTASSVTVKWQPAAGATGYRVYRDGTVVKTLGASAVSYRFASLSFGQHVLGVEALPDGGVSTITVLGQWVETASTEPTPPPPPPPPPPPSGSASVFLSPSGSDGNACTQAAPCLSFARAYAVAADGATVSVAAGTYAAQSFAGGWDGPQAAGTKRVTFKGDPGNVVRGLHVGSPNLTFDGINVDAGGVRTNGAAVENGGGDNFRFVNGSIGNVTDEKAALVDGSGIVFDNVVFHDVLLATDGVHNECLYAIVVPGMVLRNSTFRNCATMDVFFTFGDWWSPLPAPYGNVTVEGNTFWHSTCSGCTGVPAGWHYAGMVIGNVASPAPGTLNGWTVRNNWFEQDVSVAPSVGTGNTFCGNTGAAPAEWKVAC